MLSLQQLESDYRKLAKLAKISLNWMKQMYLMGLGRGKGCDETKTISEVCSYKKYRYSNSNITKN